MKRRSSAGGEPALKRQMLEDSKVVAAAVKQNKSLPTAVQSLLSEASQPCLSTYADQRHRYQEEVVDMVAQALSGVEVTLQAAVTEATAGLDALDRAQLQAQIIEEAHKRAAAKGTDAQKEATVVETSLKYRLAEETLKLKLKEQKAGDADYNAVDAKKAMFQDAIAKVEAAKAAVTIRKEMHALEAALKACSVDASLIAVLPNVLMKEPAARGEFDAVMMQNLDGALAESFAAVEAELKPLEPAKATRASEVAAAQAAYDAAKEARDAAKEEHKKSSAAVAAADNSLKAAEGAEKHFAETFKTAETKKKSAEQELGKFQEGPLATFSKLKDQKTPPPPPEPEAEAGTEGAPAEAAPAAVEA